MDFVIKGLVAVLILSSVDNRIWTDSMTDQEKCQAEADYMAKNYAYRHVYKCIGKFEGIGYGGSHPKISTCTPKYKMTLTGDASAQSPNGKWVRVRSWR